jgi:hypothetical protein
MHKELRPHQIDLLIGNQSVNNEFSQKVRELERRLQMNDLSYRDWETLNDRQHDIFSQDMFLDGECATSVKDYVKGAVNSCGCPDTEEELHHHSPVLMREIEKQQDMLPDMKVKIGESLNNLNETIDLLLENIILQEIVVDPVMSAMFSGDETRINQERENELREDFANEIDALVKQIEASEKALGTPKNKKYYDNLKKSTEEQIVGALAPLLELPYLSLDSEILQAYQTEAADLKKSLQQMTAQIRNKDWFAQNGLKVWQDMVDDKQQKTSNYGQQENQKYRLISQAAVDAMTAAGAEAKVKVGDKEFRLQTFERLVNSGAQFYARLRYEGPGNVKEQGVPIVIDKDYRIQNKEDLKPLMSATLFAALPEDIKFPESTWGESLTMAVNKFKETARPTDTEATKKALSGLATFYKTKTEKVIQMAKKNPEAFKASLMLLGGYTFFTLKNVTHGTLQIPLDVAATEAAMAKQYAEVFKEYDNEVEGMSVEKLVKDSGITIPQFISVSQLVKSDALGGKGGGTLKEEAHMELYNQQLKNEGIADPTKNPYNLTILASPSGPAILSVAKVSSDMTQTAQEGRKAPKSDLQVSYEGDKTLYLSHKDGKSPSSFQQWGGVTDDETGLNKSKAVQTFLRELEGAPGIGKSKTIPTATVYAYDPSLVASDEENEWAAKMLSSLFGPGLSIDGGVVSENQKSEAQNCDVVIQHEMILEKGDDGLVMKPHHAIARKDIEGLPVMEAFDLIFGEENNYNEYSPVIMAKYDSGRNNLEFKNMRAGVYPRQNRKVAFLLVPQENGSFKWVGEQEGRKKYPQFKWGKNEVKESEED